MDSTSRHNQGWLVRIDKVAQEHLADSVSPYHKVRSSTIVQRIGNGNRLSVVDVGCGYGLTLRGLAERGHDCFGCDISSDLVSYHRANSPWAQFRVSQIGRPLPFEDGQFDVAILAEVVEHCYDVAALLEAVKRCLKRPGGRLIVTTPYHAAVKCLALIVSGRYDTHFDPRGQHIRFFTVKSLSMMLHECGFRVNFWKGIGRCPCLYKSMLLDCVVE